jgi:hypothetical protein
MDSATATNPNEIVVQSEICEASVLKSSVAVMTLRRVILRAYFNPVRSYVNIKTDLHGLKGTTPCY